MVTGWMPPILSSDFLLLAEVGMKESMYVFSKLDPIEKELVKEGYLHQIYGNTFALGDKGKNYLDSFRFGSSNPDSTVLEVSSEDIAAHHIVNLLSYDIDGLIHAAPLYDGKYESAQDTLLFYNYLNFVLDDTLTYLAQKTITQYLNTFPEKVLEFLRIPQSNPSFALSVAARIPKRQWGKILTQLSVEKAAYFKKIHKTQQFLER